MDKERFSMLLLEPGEIYFEDYSVVWLQRDSEKQNDSEKLNGRLKLCSKSLVFEPKDRVKPLIKVQFKECRSISQCNDVFISNSNNIISIACNQYVKMLEGNIIAPYKVESESKEFLFLLNYASIADCVQQMNQLKRASELHACEQNSMVATILHSRYSRMRFDLLWLDNLYDKIILEMNADRISPLVKNPGKIVLTVNTLFFQPCNNIESYPVLKIRLVDIRRLFRRRFLLRQTGLEIYNKETCETPHIYLAFKSKEDRDEIFNKILESPNLNLDNTEQSEMTMQWQNGVLSNYDYLLYLNSLADRTKTDLTQYPIFPWVLSDYTSSTIDLDDVNVYRDLRKPIGALNAQRLDRLKDRYEEMAPPKFLYGSHYSAPGLILFYIVRTCPNFMLCLQNGRFDHPDRMFNSISDVYRNCLNNMADFKELIPEFFDIENKGDFLVNKYGIQFGFRHDGTKVEHVKLPPWAKSPERFIKIMRDALESDYVSKNLHHWIDLIFGYKQRGEEAEKADNIFFHLCYEGAINLDDIADMNERDAVEVQIMEFGQIPKQLFKTPHVRRMAWNTKRDSKHSIEYSLTNPPVIKSLVQKSSFHSHKEGVSCVIISDDGQRVISVGEDSLLKVYSITDEKQIRSVNVGSLPLSSCVQMNNNTIIVGSWDNYILMYDLEYGRVVDSFRAHDDAVNCLSWSLKSNILISGGWDGVVRVWSSLDGFGKGSFRPLQSLKAEFDHDSKITCIALNDSTSILMTGTDEGEVSLWNLDNKTLKCKLLSHSQAISGGSFISQDKRLVVCSSDGEFRVIDLSANVQVYNNHISEGLSSLSCSDNILCLGSSKGMLYVWDLLSVAQIYQIRVHEGAVKSIAIDLKKSLIVTGSEDHHVNVWSTVEECNN